MTFFTSKFEGLNCSMALKENSIGTLVESASTSKFNLPLHHTSFSIDKSTPDCPSRLSLEKQWELQIAHFYEIELANIAANASKNSTFTLKPKAFQLKNNISGRIADLRNFKLHVIDCSSSIEQNQELVSTTMSGTIILN